jgi:tRNA threonylcarbamoyladenosine dehydratase
MENLTENVTQSPAPAYTIVEDNYTLHRRFDRMGRLVGDENMKKLFNSHVMIIGLGGVGSWTAESLTRSGVGKLTIIDHDEICITNANRQLHALQGLVGKKKAEVMGERLRKINPQAQVQALPMFYNKDTSAEILAHKPDYIVDAIDNLTAKTYLLNQCREQNIKVITSGGASAKIDPMSHTVRKILRQDYNFPRTKFFDIPCVFSDEIPMEPVELHYDLGQGFKCVCPQMQDNPHGCLHRNVIYGTSSFVTGAFGLAMASWVVRQITGIEATLSAGPKKKIRTPLTVENQVNV